MQTTINKAKGLTAAIISSGTFGMIPLFSIPLMTTAGMNTTSVLLYRYVISAIAVLLFCWMKKKSLKISLRASLKLFGISLLYAGTAIGLLYSYGYVASGIVTTIHFMYPVVVVLFMAIIYKEKISIKLIITSLVAIVGVGFLSLSGDGDSNVFGLSLALLTAVTYGLYVVSLNDKDVSSLDSKVVTFYVLIFGAIIFALVNQISGLGLSPVPNLTAWINLLMLALFPTVISILTLVYAVKYVGSTTTSILGAAEPLVAMLVGVSVFSEQFTIFSLIGFGLIIIAVTYVILLTKKGI